MEVIILLEHVIVIEAKSRNISEGKIIIEIDCRQVFKKIVIEIVKTSQILCNKGSKIEEI